MQDDIKSALEKQLYNSSPCKPYKIKVVYFLVQNVTFCRHTNNLPECCSGQFERRIFSKLLELAAKQTTY